MKRFVCFLITAALLLLLAACGEGSAPPFSQSDAASESAAASESPSGKPSPKGKEDTVRHPRRKDGSDHEVSNSDTSRAISYRDENGTIRAIGISEYKNTGDTPLNLSNAVMEFTAQDGTCFTSDSVEAFPRTVAPGESAFYFEQLTPDLADSGELTVKVTPGEAKPAELIRYDIGSAELHDSPYGGVVISGTVTNQTDADAELVCVAAILYDENETAVAVMYQILFAPLAAGASSEFTLENYTLPSEITAQSIGMMDLFAYPI